MLKVPPPRGAWVIEATKYTEVSDVCCLQFLVRLVPTLLGRHTFQTPPRWQASSCGRVLNARHCSDDSSTSEASLGRKFVPRRAMMYVPGNDERKLKKVPSLDLDCVVMDCEDGVAINRKVRNC